jgi:hypothetical protein
MPIRLALPPRRFDMMGAGLEPKKQYGKPFHRDPTAPPDLGGYPPKRTKHQIYFSCFAAARRPGNLIGIMF